MPQHGVDPVIRAMNLEKLKQEVSEVAGMMRAMHLGTSRVIRAAVVGPPGGLSGLRQGGVGRPSHNRP
jgi:hypothetical protein